MAAVVEPGPGDMVKSTTTTEHTVVVSDRPQLVCTALSHSVTALQVAVLGELAVGSLACPATAVATRQSDVTLSDGRVSIQHSNHEDTFVQKNTEPLIASRADALADTHPLVAPAAVTDDAALCPSHTSNAIDADCTYHQCTSAAAALAHQQPAVAVGAPCRLLPVQEDQPGVISVPVQSIIDQAQASASKTASQQRQQDQMQHSNSIRDPCMYPTATVSTDFKVDSNVAPNFGPIADPQAAPCADPHDKSTLDAHAAPHVLQAADLGAASVLLSQPHTAASQSDEPPDTAEGIQDGHMPDTHIATALTEATAAAAAASAESDATAMLPACAPQLAVLEVNEHLADLAAELAAMMALAESSSALTANSLDEITQSSNVEHCQDGAAALSCTEDPGPIVVEPTEAPTTITATVSSTYLSVPAGNVHPAAASMRFPAILEQEQGIASPKERDKSPSCSERLLAAAAAASEEAGVMVHVDPPLDATAWHAALVEVSWHFPTQLHNMLADEGTA